MSKPTEKSRSQAATKEMPSAAPDQAADQAAAKEMPPDAQGQASDLAVDESSQAGPDAVLPPAVTSSDDPASGDQLQLYVALIPISHNGDRFDPDIKPFLSLSADQAEHLMRVGAIKHANEVEAP